MGKFITFFVLLTVSSGCVREKFYLCPDWGKYRILFYDKSSGRDRVEYNVVIQDETGSHRYLRTPDTTQLKSDKVLKLFPGKYSFKALLSRKPLETANRPVVKNGCQYLYADTSVNIIKAGVNPVELDFKLANSLIIVRCSFDPGYNESHQIAKMEISCPDDDSVTIDMLTGSTNYAQTISPFYEECLYDVEQKDFYYYCVPVIKGNYLNFRVYVRDNNDLVIKTLSSRIFLNTNIEQGKAYLFIFNVTPYKIEYMTTTIIDWDDYCHNNIITFY